MCKWLKKLFHKKEYYIASDGRKYVVLTNKEGRKYINKISVNNKQYRYYLD